MFDLNFAKIDRYSFEMKYIALTNLFAAWYMLNCLKLSDPLVDTTLARIYFSEYGIETADLSNKDVAEMAKEYSPSVIKFFRKCQIQRCENIIDRFGKIGYDNRLPHAITLPLQCKEFFLELLALNANNTTENITTKETQCMDSLRDAMIVNNTMSVTGRGEWGNWMGNKLDGEYKITPDQFATYTDIIHNAVIDLYRPLNALDETFEDWGTKFRRVIDYIKTLVFMVTRDVAFNSEYFSYQMAREEDIVNPLAVLKAPFVNLGFGSSLFEHAKNAVKRATRYDLVSMVESVVAPYSSLKLEHAICLFHDSNAKLDTSKLPQTNESETFKFLCCQEFIVNLDQKIREQMLSRTGEKVING